MPAHHRRNNGEAVTVPAHHRRIRGTNRERTWSASSPAMPPGPDAVRITTGSTWIRFTRQGRTLIHFSV